MQLQFATIVISFLADITSAALCRDTCKKKQQLPHGLNCGKGGTLSHPASSGFSYVGNYFNNCISICADPAYHCVSFGYSSQTQYCTLYTERLIDMGYYQRRKDVDGTKYWNRKCFDCEYSEECQPPAGNLIVNGGFECGTGVDISPWYSYPGSQTFQICQPYEQAASEGNCFATITARDTPTTQGMRQSVCNEQGSYNFEMVYAYKPAEGLSGAPTLRVTVGDRIIINQNVCSSSAAIGDASPCKTDPSSFKFYRVASSIVLQESPTEVLIEVLYPANSTFTDVFIDDVKLH